MTAEVHVVLGAAKNVLTVPASALGSGVKTGKASLRVVGADNAIVTRAVDIGLNDGVNAEVKSGLNEGEKIVIGQADPSAKPAPGGFGPPPGGM